MKSVTRGHTPRVVASLTGALAALMVCAVAFAHAEPVTMSPADGATVAVLPTIVSMNTGEDMVAGPGTSLVVVNGSGTQVNVAASVVDAANPKHISVALPAGLPAGTYSVRWNTVATDGDAANGSWLFTYAPAQATATPSPTASPAPTASATVAATATATAAASPTVVATSAPTAAATSTAVAAAATPSAPRTGMGAEAATTSSYAAVLLLLGAVTLTLGARAVVRATSDR